MKQTIDYIKKYFTIWWVPILFYFIAIGIFFLGNVFERDWIIDLSLILFFSNTIGTLISSIVQIVIRKWYFIIPQLGLGAFLFYWTIIVFMYSPPDYYGKDKEIPNDIKFSEPLNEKPNKEDFDKQDLILVHGGQPGIYTYYTDYQPDENGKFFIKAYEITSNDRLSGDRMKESSKIIIKLEKQRQPEYKGEFTIYEGSWGDKYGSRIELWFQPMNGKEEYKIAKRNYIVEGWMR